jgi:hypothetical protein
MKNYIKKQAENYAEGFRYAAGSHGWYDEKVMDFTDGFTSAADLMPRLLAFYADNFRRTDQDFDKVVKMFFEKLNKQQ